MSRRGLTFFRWGWTAFVIVLTSAPYFMNWRSTPPGYHYTWILPPYPEDSFGYMAWAQQAAHGAWLFKIKYTALAHDPFLFHPFFLICGWLSALFSCEIGIVFWIVKAIGVGLFFFVFYRYVDYLGFNANQSIAASILIGVSSGLGGILLWSGVTAPWAMTSTDLWMPEVSTFWSLLWNPLFPFSLALMLLSIFWTDRGTQEERRSDLWRSGLATGVLTLLHPYALPLLFALTAIVTIGRRKMEAVGYLWRYSAASVPFLIYVATLSWRNPLLAQHSVTGAMKSPPLIECALGFGLPLLVFLAGLVVLRNLVLKKYWQLVLWFFLAVILAYFPFWFQRKLIFGAQIPICLIAAVVFEWAVTRWAPERKRTLIRVMAMIFCLPLLTVTTAYLLVTEQQTIKTNPDNAYFVENELIDGLKILRERAKPDDVVLATPATSRLIPALAGNTVVWGHWAMSIDYKERQTALARTIEMGSDASDETRASAFWDNGIQFIFADGKLKQHIERDPAVWEAILRNAQKIFENGSVVIYQRNRP
jgi:hypothetical protein